jgi:hypothetical protein
MGVVLVVAVVMLNSHGKRLFADEAEEQAQGQTIFHLFWNLLIII